MYIVFTYLSSFTGYEGDIFDFISDLHIQKYNFAGKFTNLADNLEKNELC